MTEATPFCEACRGRTKVRRDYDYDHQRFRYESLCCGDRLVKEDGAAIPEAELEEIYKEDWRIS